MAGMNTIAVFTGIIMCIAANVFIGHMTVGLAILCIMAGYGVTWFALTIWVAVSNWLMDKDIKKKEANDPFKK